MDCRRRPFGRPPRGPAPLHPERTVCRNGSARPERIPQLLHRPLPSQRNRDCLGLAARGYRRPRQDLERPPGCPGNPSRFAHLPQGYGRGLFPRQALCPELGSGWPAPRTKGRLPLLPFLCRSGKTGRKLHTLNRRALTWLKAVEKHYGRRPVVYTSDRFALDILSSDITEHYPLWIARYGGKTPDSPACTMWQFTDRAVIHGIRGYVDLSVVTTP